MAAYEVRAIPDTILIDPDGRIRARFTGRDEDVLRGALVEERERQMGRSARRGGQSKGEF